MSTNASGTASSESAVELSLQPDNAILIDEDGTVGEDEGHETGSTASNASTEIADGELLQLMESVDEDSTPLPPRIEMAVTRELSVRDHLQIDSLTDKAYYGHPLPLSEAEEQMPVGNEGLIWHALIIPDEYFVKGKLKRGLNPRDFDAVNCKIKPRRPSLPVTATDFFSSLTRVEGPEKCQARYIFHGLLNGWPSLRTLELIALEERRGGSALPSPKDLLTGQFLWSNTWSAKDEGMRGKDPKILQQPNPIYSIISQQQQQHRIYRATLRGAPWSGTGWSDEAPGFVFWYEAEAATPRVSHGTNIVRDLLDPTPQCTTVHMISHRYAVERESPRDRLTYHSLCLLEWSHGKYCTVAEAAYLNGTGGHKGKVNWYDDRDEPVTAFYKMMPPEMVAPWKTSRAEIRMYDVKAKNMNEFRAYVMKYKNQRFVDPHFTFSHPVRLTFRSKGHIAQYLVNYIRRDSKYDLLSKNCQTFAADLCSFLAGKKDIVPFHPVNRIDFQPRNHLFLYDSEMYEARAKPSRKIRK